MEHLTPLDETQQKDVDELVARRRLERVPPDRARAENFLEKARHRLDDVQNLIWAEGRYTFAYDAAHDVGEALLSAYGLRTKNGAGQHEAIGRFLQVILSTPPGRAGARRFDQMRRSRNQQHYEARIVGEADAELAIRSAEDLYDGAIDRGLAGPSGRP